MGVFQFTDPSSGEFALSCGRNNTNVSNLWLRDGHGTPLNLSPWIIPFDCTLVAISVSTRQAGTWDFEVYAQPDVRNGGIPTFSNNIAHIPLVGANEAYENSLSVALSAGDGIGIFARGSGISYPRVTVWIERN